MADPTFINQEAALVGADDAKTSTSQQSTLVGADGAKTEVSQQSALVGAGDAATFISQAAPLAGADDAGTLVHQLVFLVGRGPTIAPPAESPTRTYTVGEGLGNNWFIALQLSDSGDELRDKVVKSVRVTGKVTNCRAKVYGYGPMQNISVEDIEKGNGQRVTVQIPNTDDVQQSKRHQINVPNCMTHTIRIEGSWPGEGRPDRVDEITMEVSRQGIRR